MRHFDEHRCGGRFDDHPFRRAMRRGGHGPFGRPAFGPDGRHDGFGRDGTRRGGGPGGRRRMFEAGELRLVLLLLMEGEPRHGYDLIREIETRTGGAYAPSPGIVYPTLTLLEELEQVTAVAEGAKRLFTITETGRQELEEQRQAAEAAMARLDGLKAEREPFDTGPIQRAMQNLGAALRQRLGHAPDRDAIFAVTDILDEAARRIERL